MRGFTVTFMRVRSTILFAYSLSFQQARIIMKNGLEPYGEGTAIEIFHWMIRRTVPSFVPDIATRTRFVLSCDSTLTV